MRQFDEDRQQQYEEFFHQENENPSIAIDADGQAKFLTTVFGWMTMGLATTALISFAVMSNVELLRPVFDNIMILFLVELGLVWWLSARIGQMSSGTATALFIAYAVMNGLTIAPILSVYTASSAASVFMITAGTFAAMSLYGLTTKKDLTSWGSLLMMGLIGLIISHLVNMFMGSATFSYIISGIGVFIFVGLTAYDSQKLKDWYADGIHSRESLHKMAIMGALMLYLDFVNLFLYLLRLFGSRDE